MKIYIKIRHKNIKNWSHCQARVDSCWVYVGQRCWTLIQTNTSHLTVVNEKQAFLPVFGDSLLAH